MAFQSSKDKIKLIAASAVLLVAVILIAYNVLGSDGPAQSASIAQNAIEPAVDNTGVVPGKEVPPDPPRGKGVGKRQSGSN